MAWMRDPDSGATMPAMAFTAVDLSRLPVPDIIEQLDYETLLADALAQLRALDPTFDALVESDPAYKILQVAVYRELLLRQDFNERLKGTMLAYATGAALDHLGALMGVQRLVLDPGDPGNGIPETLESDTDFRRRIQLAPEGFSVAGPEGAYVYHALAAHPDVLDASATSPSPGEVVVTVLSRHGDGSASSSLLDAVSASLSSDDVRPMTDHVTVQGATIVPYAIAATLYTYAGPDPAVVLATAQRRLQDYVSQSHRLGRDVALSGILAALHAEGVQRVALSAPTADIVVDRTQAAWCASIDIAHGGVDE